MFRISFTFILVLFVTITSFSACTNAQAITTAVTGIDMSLSTNNPIPGQTVKVTARSYVIDINSATVVWKVNGKEVERGIGKTEISVRAPAQGKKTIVNVFAVTLDGKTVSNEVYIGSGSIDLILETSGYVPPFFLGKLSPVYQNTIKIVAMPHLSDSNGVEYDPKNLVYRWEKNGSVIEGSSGYGKQSIEIQGSTIPRPVEILVTVTTRDGTQQAKIIKSIDYREPTIKFYKNDPVYGPLFNKELSGTVYMNTTRELGVLAVPFGFDKPINDVGNLALSWFINSTKREELSASESIIIRSPEGSYGTSDISLDINNKVNILQEGGSAFSVSFKNSGQKTTEDISF